MGGSPSSCSPWRSVGDPCGAQSAATGGLPGSGNHGLRPPCFRPVTHTGSCSRRRSLCPAPPNEGLRVPGAPCKAGTLSDLQESSISSLNHIVCTWMVHGDRHTGQVISPEACKAVLAPCPQLQSTELPSRMDGRVGKVFTENAFSKLPGEKEKGNLLSSKSNN